MGSLGFAINLVIFFMPLIRGFRPVQDRGGRSGEQARDKTGAVFTASAVFSTLFRSEFRAANFFQCRQIGLHQLPQDRCRNVLVVVAQDVADPGNFLPWDFRVTRFQLVRKVTTCLGNNFHAALHEPLSLPIVFECVE